MTLLIKKLSLILVFCFIAHSAAHAHKVTIFAYAEGDRVFTESKFSGGKKVKNGEVTVFDSEGRQLLKGRTDDNGHFSFTVPTISDLNIVLTAGMGHQNTWKLSTADLGAPSGDPVETASSPSAVPAAQEDRLTRGNASGLSVQDVEAVVARQLEQKLQPLTRMIAAAQDKGPTASDIFGGIGYIIGLVGLGAYLRYRKDGRRS